MLTLILQPIQSMPGGWGGLGLVVGVRQLNEKEAPFAAGVAVERQAALAHRAVIGKQVLKVLSCRNEGEVAPGKGH